MAYPVTLNGRTYTLADFEGNNYVDGLPDAFEDFVTHAGDIYNDTSTTSNSIGTGSKTFTVAAGKPYQAGTPLRIADAAAPATNFLDAVVTSYSGTTLVVEAIGYGGSGTLTSWTVNIGGAKTIDGTLGVSQGGTGATTAAAARTNLETYSKTEADSRFLNVSGEASDVTMTGNVTIGDAAGDTLTVNATPTLNAGATIIGDLNVDSGTLKVDSSNNRVSVGTTTTYPGNDFTVGATAPTIVLDNGSGTILGHFGSAGTGTNEVTLKSSRLGPLILGTNNSEKMRISSGGFLGVGDSNPYARLSIASGSGGNNTGMQIQRTDSGGAKYWIWPTATVNGEGAGKLLFQDATSGSAVDVMSFSGGKVGLGTKSPTTTLHVYDQGAGGDGTVNIGGTSSVATGQLFYEISGTTYLRLKNTYRSTNANAYMEFDAGYHKFLTGTGGSEAARFDSGGNLAVGSTSAVPISDQVDGVAIRGDGSLQASRNNADPAAFARRGTDGDIVKFFKNGGVVGSIAAWGGDLNIGTGDVRLKFTDSVPAFLPRKANDANSDNYADLGDVNNRFKDLYLSGGVYLGGVGSSNKLDDYEEGTWDPTIEGSSTNPTVSYDAQRGVYTKIGRLVVVNFYMDTSSVTGGTGDLRVGGLPFNISSSSEALGASQAEYKGITMPSDANNIFIRVNPSSSFLNLEFLDTRAGVTVESRGNITLGSLASDSRVLATVSYITDA